MQFILFLHKYNFNNDYFGLFWLFDYKRWTRHIKNKKIQVLLAPRPIFCLWCLPVEICFEKYLIHNKTDNLSYCLLSYPQTVWYQLLVIVIWFDHFTRGLPRVWYQYGSMLEIVWFVIVICLYPNFMVNQFPYGWSYDNEQNRLRQFFC